MTLKVDVVVSGLIGGRFRQERLILELSGEATVRTLLSEIKKRLKLDLMRADDAGLTIMLSGRLLALPADADVSLTDGDLLAALSPLVGGSTANPDSTFRKAGEMKI